MGAMTMQLRNVRFWIRNAEKSASTVSIAIYSLQFEIYKDLLDLSLCELFIVNCKLPR